MDKPRGHQEHKYTVSSIFAEIYFAQRELRDVHDWSATCKSRDFCATISCLGAETLKKHKAISMMRGKSPPSEIISEIIKSNNSFKFFLNEVGHRCCTLEREIISFLSK